MTTANRDAGGPFLDSHAATLAMQANVRPNYHPDSYATFFAEWIDLLQVNIFPTQTHSSAPARRNEYDALRRFAEANEGIWLSLDTAALTELVQQRYIRTHALGSTTEQDATFVKERVRDATDYLRAVLDVPPDAVVGATEPHSFESGRPADLTQNQFANANLRLAAALAVVYQIRCNLFHGVKGYRNRSSRDQLLVGLGVKVIQAVKLALSRTGA